MCAAPQPSAGWLWFSISGHFGQMMQGTPAIILGKTILLLLLLVISFFTVIFFTVIIIFFTIVHTCQIPFGIGRKGKATPEAMPKLPGKPSFLHRRHLLLQNTHTSMLQALWKVSDVIAEDYYYFEKKSGTLGRTAKAHAQRRLAAKGRAPC